MCLLLKDLKHYVSNGRMVFGRCIFFLWIVQFDRLSSKTSTSSVSFQAYHSYTYQPCCWKSWYLGGSSGDYRILMSLKCQLLSDGQSQGSRTLVNRTSYWQAFEGAACTHMISGLSRKWRNKQHWMVCDWHLCKYFHLKLLFLERICSTNGCCLYWW